MAYLITSSTGVYVGVTGFSLTLGSTGKGYLVWYKPTNDTGGNSYLAQLTNASANDFIGLQIADGTDTTVGRSRSNNGALQNASIGTAYASNSWHLFGVYGGAFNGATNQTTSVFVNGTSNVINTITYADASADAFIEFSVGNGNSAIGAVMNATVYDGISIATFESLMSTAWNSYNGTTNLYKSPTHPDMTSIASPYIRLRLFEDITDVTVPGGATVTNNGPGSFDTDTPLYASEGGGATSTGNRLIMW